MRLRERSSIHTWSEDMDSNTFIGFEEFISSMGTWFEERTSSMGTRVPKKGRFSEALEGGRSDSGIRWKGRWRWESIVTVEEEVRGEQETRWRQYHELDKISPNFSLLFFSYFLHYFLKENITIFSLIFSFISFFPSYFPCHPN